MALARARCSMAHAAHARVPFVSASRDECPAHARARIPDAACRGNAHADAGNGSNGWKREAPSANRLDDDYRREVNGQTGEKSSGISQRVRRFVTRYRSVFKGAACLPVAPGLSRDRVIALLAGSCCRKCKRRPAIYRCRIRPHVARDRAHSDVDGNLSSQMEFSAPA